jgi:two-component system sensor histidine kinase YesM
MIVGAAAILAAAAVLAEKIFEVSDRISMITAVVLLVLLVWWMALTVRNQKLMMVLAADNKKKKNAQVDWAAEEEEKLQIIQQKVELSTLQMQINPHFLYNTLEVIRSYALVNGQQEIAVMTEKVSRYFRYCIGNSDHLVQIREETSHIMDYYYIQKQRFADRFTMEIRVETEAVYDYYIPKLILQPLVENAVSHGIERVMRKGQIVIHIFTTEKKLILQVSDNGCGIAEEQLEALNDKLRKRQVQVPSSKKGRSNGVAIMNANSRIKIAFGDEYGIHYRSMEDVGTDVIVTLPQIDEFTRTRYEGYFQG